jgi:predicted DNA-binding transcriptional regulator YafY
MESHPNLAALQLPDRAVQPVVVRELLRACRNSHSLIIGYASMHRPEQHEREIAPHTLVYTGFRWHVRAWCHEREAFRDFVLSRIIGKPHASDRNAPAAANDDAWQRMIEFRLTPNHRLNAGQRSVVARDFGMRDESLNLSCREALVHYALQRYPAAISENHAERNQEFPLQVHPEDFHRVAPFLFNAGTR